MKAVPSDEKLLPKKEDWRPPEVNFGPFSNFLLPKTAGFLAEDSSDTFNNKLKWKYNWKSDQKQFTNYNYNYVSFVSFVSSLFIVIVVIRILSSKGVRYNTLSSPFFTVTYSKLVHGPKKKSYVRGSYNVSPSTFTSTLIFNLQLHRKIGFSNSGLFVN